MADLRIGGLISGLNTEAWLQKLMEAERAPLRAAEERRRAVQLRQQAWSGVRGALETLRARLDALRLVSTFRARQATLGDPTVADVTVGAGAALVTHSLSVNKLAQAHSVASSNYRSPNLALNLSGTFTVNGKVITVTAQDTLNSIRDKINAAGAGVSASVVQLLAGGTVMYRLVLTSSSQGLAGRINLSDGAYSASSSDPAVVTATATGQPAAGSYEVTVTQLAQAHQVQSNWVPDTQTYSGTIQINGTDIALNNATLADIAAAINGAGVGVTASVAYDGSGNARLTLTADQTGTANAVAFTADPNSILQAVGLANADLTPKNVVQAAQDAAFTVNGTAYTRSSNTGLTDVIPGLTLDLTGTGTATVTVEPTGVLRGLGVLNDAGQPAVELAAAQDAEFTLDGVTYTRSSNTVTDALPGLTLTLKKAGASTTFTVGQDVAKAVDAVKAMVQAFNSAVDLLARQTAYDPENQTAGALNGDSLAVRLRNSLRDLVSRQVPGLPATLSQLSQVGVTTGAWGTSDYGKLVVDETKLRDKLAADPDGVARLFGALRVNVAAATNGASVTATSTASSGGTFSPDDVINGDTDSARFGSMGGGWQSAGVPSASTPEELTVTFNGTRTIDEVRIYLPDPSQYPSIRDVKIQYQDASGTWHDAATVAGNTGSLITSRFSPVVAKAIRLHITGTNSGAPARVVEVEALETNGGVATRLWSLADGALKASGAIAAREEGFAAQLKEIDSQIARLNDRLARRELALRRQFERMEQALAQLRSQGTALANQLLMIR